MKKQKEKDNSILFRIDSELKKSFNIKCLEENTSMSEAIISFIKEYIQKK